MEDKDWVDETLAGLENVVRAEADSLFLEKLEIVALSHTKKSQKIPRFTVFSIAASFVLLLMANVYVIGSSNIENNTVVTEIEYNYDFVPSNSLYK